MVKVTWGYKTGFLETKGLGPGPYRRDDPAILIVIDTNNAGDRLEVSGSKQLLGMPGQEDAIHCARDDLEGLKGHWLLRSKVRSLTILMLDYSLPLLSVPSQDCHTQSMSSYSQFTISWC